MKTILLLGVALASLGNATSLMSIVSAQPPRMRNADIDYEASGFVMPAGAPGFDQGHAVQQASMQGHMQRPTQYSPTQFAPGYAQPIPSSTAPTGIAQVGYFSGGGSACDAGCCGGGGGCDSPGYGPLGMGFMHGGGFRGGYQSAGYQDCQPILTGGVLGKINGNCGQCGGAGGGCGCGAAVGAKALSGLRHICLFCRGEGCSACQMANPCAALLGLLGALRPSAEGGLCSQRWYDFSVEGLFLGRTTSGTMPSVLTQRGAGAAGTPALLGGDASSGDLEAGIRLSGALIFGPGGNIEATYMGGQEWDTTQSVSAPATLIANPNFGNVALPANDPARLNPFIISDGADLYSFISEFGTDPLGGFDDTDRSISQSVESSASFHSAEINYRRRTVGPYCRFQGSWLFGLRYLRYDNRVGLNIVGLNDDGIAEEFTDGTQRFFNTSNSIDNSMLGAQIGGDLWWNVIPGVSFGIDGKLAWLKNEARSEYTIAANSINGVGGAGVITDSFREDDGTLAMEFQTKMVYRLSHSWTFRTAYYLMAIDEVGTAGLNAGQIRESVQLGAAGTTRRPVTFNSLVLNGFSFGTEYTW